MLCDADVELVVVVAVVVFVVAVGAVVVVAVVFDRGAILTDDDELTLTASDTSKVELKLDNEDSPSSVGVAKESLD